ncbi:MAG: SDR family NAD(P)-dependent oxidoreductase [Sphingomicrobium sp.]
MMIDPALYRRVDRPLCAIVTGAANGNGAAFARALSARGASLVIADCDEVALARLRPEIGATAVRCDILDERSVGNLFTVAEEVLGHVDLLINAAGNGYIRTLGVLRASREFARRPRTERAFIVNLAAQSDPGTVGFEYAGSRIAFSRLSEGLARAIENDELKVFTIDRIEEDSAISDLAEQLVGQLTVVSSEAKGDVAQG